MSDIGNVSFDFSGRVVVVTGGGTGIGKAIAGDFARAGAQVVISGRRLDRLQQAAADIGHGVEAVAADVGRREDVTALVESTLERHGRIDVVVSNAAIYEPGQITDISVEDWERLRQTNVDGFFHLAQATLPVLARNGGSFVATSSVSGLRGDWNQAVYNATKGAISMFVQSLALDWGNRGVRINAVAPSMTNTDPVAAVVGDESLLAQSESRIALGRIAEPEDISPVVLFLASDAARYITGVVLPVDGGTSASTGQARPPQS
jgi:meso-butanediol dehydrogenase/(S,S)-butanediol dehydrogenase/diacetyl reductase